MRRLFPTARLMAAALMLSAAAVGAEPQPTPESRAHFHAGVEALREERWVDAYREFKTAYDLTPKWTALGNFGVAAQHLERDGEAIDAFEAYLERGGAELGDAEAQRVRQSLEGLRKDIATVSLAAPGPFWIVDTRIDAGQAVINEYGPFEGRAELRVRAGRHEFKLDRSGIDAAIWSVTLLAADKAEHTFVERAPAELVTELAPEEPEPSPPPEADRGSERSQVVPYVLWTTGAAASIATVVLLLEARSHQNAANEVFRTECPTGITDSPGCALAIEGDERAARWGTAGLVTGVGALGALAAGTIWYLLEPGASRESASRGVQPWIVGTTVGIKGQF